MLRQRLRDFKSNERGIVIAAGAIAAGLIMLGLGIAFMLFLYFVTSMLVQNIVPIAIAIVLIIVVPIFAKGWFQKTTGTPYDQKAVQT